MIFISINTKKPMAEINILDVNDNIIESNITEEQVTELINREISPDGLNYYFYPGDATQLNEFKTAEYSESIRFIKRVENPSE
jgi:uncharacterized protein YcfL